MPFEMALCPARQLCTLQGWRLQRVNPNSRACLAGRARRTYTPRTVSPGAEHPFLRRSDWQARERDYFITEYQCTHKCGPLPREGFRAAQGLGSRQRACPPAMYVCGALIKFTVCIFVALRTKVRILRKARVLEEPERHPPKHPLPSLPPPQSASRSDPHPFTQGGPPQS